MQCPVCSAPLQMTERSGVEIDYCPKCRGVWLDRGELDKIIERSRNDSDDERHTEKRDRRYDSDDERHTEKRDRRYDSSDSSSSSSRDAHPPKKRESFWSELFDFD
jgi:Zn-finger nucleic acid-binding protein